MAPAVISLRAPLAVLTLRQHRQHRQHRCVSMQYAAYSGLIIIKLWRCHELFCSVYCQAATQNKNPDGMTETPNLLGVSTYLLILTSCGASVRCAPVAGAPPPQDVVGSGVVCSNP
jgi:hypothetical protein